MAVKLFYFAHWLRGKNIPILPRIVELILRYFCGCELHASMIVGTGLQLPHNGIGLVVNPNTIIGNNVKLYQNVTIGGREGSGAPIIEDDVLVGAGAVILGDICIHSGAKIGANAVVLHDVPERAIAVGVPAVVKIPKGEE